MSNGSTSANPMKESRKFCFKIAVVGNSQVGKISLMKKFIHSPFSRNYDKTLGVKVSLVDNEIEDDLIRLLFWVLNNRIQN
ncbi:MAG: hypothetical protein ACXABO_18585 [Promethearchaeota archaeon]|jgi:GTPase SAR1 family protein